MKPNQPLNRRSRSENGDRTKKTLRRFGALLNTILELNESGKALVDTTKLLKEFDRHIDHRVKARGADEAAKFFKEVYQVARQLATGKRFNPIPWTKSDKEGVPRILGPLVPLLISDSEHEKRVGLSIAKIYTSVFSKREPDLSPITSEGKEFQEFDRHAWKRYLTRISLPLLPETDGDLANYHLTTKAGPNGPALMTSDLDAAALEEYPQIRDAVGRLGGSNLELHITYLNLFGGALSGAITTPLKISKLSIVREGGAKNRVIAIGDYFTQESLKPLHDLQFKWLGRQPEDGTYHQGQTVKLVRRALRAGKPVFCFDLSNATDRFPLSIQKEVIRKMVGQDRADSWEELLVKRPFKYRDRDVYYRVGQPMGFYSSWSTFTMTHHLFIRYCAFLEGITSYKKYVVIGDDVSIFDERLAARYRKMMEDIGVPISLMKSTIYRPGDPGLACGEIAKRLVTVQGEITPIPYRLIQTWSENPHLEALTLRKGLDGIGIATRESLFQTLAVRCHMNKVTATRFLVTALAPEALIGRRRPQIAKDFSLGVSRRATRAGEDPELAMIWQGRDLQSVPSVLAQLLTKELESAAKMYQAKLLSEFPMMGGTYLAGTDPDDPQSVLDALLKQHPASIVVNRITAEWEQKRASAHHSVLIALYGSVDIFDSFRTVMEWVDAYRVDSDFWSKLNRRRRQSRRSADLLYKVWKRLPVKEV